jgi:WD40 repeat protein
MALSERTSDLALRLISILVVLLTEDAGLARQQKPELVLEDSSTLAFSPRFGAGGNFIIANCNKRPIELGFSEVKIWDGTTGKLRTHIDGKLATTEPAISPDGTLVAAITRKNCVQTWDVGGKEKGSLKGHAFLPLRLAFSPDNKQIATGNADDTVTLFELGSGREKILRAHTSSIYCVAFNADGKLLGSGSRDGVLKLWDVATGTQKASLRGNSGGIYSILFSKDSTLVVDATGQYDLHDPEPTVIVWDLIRSRITMRLKGCTTPALRGDGKYLAVLAQEATTVQVWDTAADKQTLTCKLKPGSVGLDLYFASDGGVVALVRDDSRIKVVPISARDGS